MAHSNLTSKSARAILALAAILIPAAASAYAQAAAAPEDELIFANGDKLTGKLTRIVGDSVAFHSDVAGDVTVSLAKVKELHTQGAFALLKPGETEKMSRTIVTGKVDVVDAKVTVTPPQAAPETTDAKDVAYLLDDATFKSKVEHKPGLMDGWNGTATLGATVVQASTHGDTFTVGTALVRQLPVLSLFPVKKRTLLNFQETYGTLTQDAEPAAGIAYSSVKTSIMHAGAEQDEYLSKKFFVLGTATFDHNYALLLQLQQIYGVGVGYTVFSNANHELDVRVDAHYEKQQFAEPASNVNLVGSTFSETYRRTLPLKIQFTEALALVPSWNDPSVFSANFNGGLALPVWKRLAVNLSTTDSYLTNPPSGTTKNSFQFVTGLSYSIK